MQFALQDKQTWELQDVQHDRIGQLVQQTGSCSFGLNRSNVTRPPDTMDQSTENRQMSQHKTLNNFPNFIYANLIFS